MHRRDFLSLSLLASGSLLLRPLFAQAPDLQLAFSDTVVANLSRYFLGLSYESRQLGDPTFFSARNTELVALFRLLGPGSLRIGGNTSEYCFFKRDAQAPPQTISADPDKGHAAPPETIITPAAIRNLREFLDATDWQLIYGLNLGKGSPENSAAEAAFVYDTVGSRLTAFQIGNEPDLFPQNGLRPHDWSFDQFAAEWQQHFDAIRKRVSHARFAGPADAYKTDWTRQFAARFKTQIEVLTQHYYAEGPPTDPSMNIDRLLNVAPERQAKLFAELTAIAKQNGVPWRLAETNSCYSGGKEGVSDTFAASLWGADMLFQLATAGAQGINFHGGGNGWYTPIAGSAASGFTARPLFYAMLLFAQAQPTAIFRPPLAAADPFITAYAFASAGGQTKLAIFNKDPERARPLSLRAAQFKSASAQALEAPALDATSGVTLASAEVVSSRWVPSPSQIITPTAGAFHIDSPPASGLLLSLQR